uniref:Uncharacterized protein n=1 Tax=Acrobeloides nanus TaxID=290746 RepID=A0A914DK34_9BILA
MHSIILAVTSAVMYLAMGASANPEPQVHVNIPQSIVNNPNKPKFLFFPSQSLTPELRRQQAITNWQEQNRLACLARCKRSAEGEDNQVIIRAKRSSRVKRQCGCGSSCVTTTTIAAAVIVAAAVAAVAIAAVATTTITTNLLSYWFQTVATIMIAAVAVPTIAAAPLAAAKQLTSPFSRYSSNGK